MMISEVGTVAEPATIAHSVPGRLRLRVPSLRHGDWRRAELERLAQESERIGYVETRPAARSLLVEYDPAAGSVDEVLAELSDALELSVQSSETAMHRRLNGDRVAGGVRDVMHSANRKVAEATGGFDLRLLVPGVLFVLSVGSLMGARRREMPGWHTMLWYAYQLFDKLNPPDPLPVSRRIDHQQPADFT